MWPQPLNRGSCWIDVWNTAVYWQKIGTLESGRLKVAKYEIQKPSTCRALQVLVDVSRFSPCMINLIRNRNICYRSKKCSALIGWFARARANLLRVKLSVWWKRSNKTKLDLLHKVDPRFNFRNNFLQPEKNIFVARQVEGFCISYFAALMEGGRLVQVRLYY